MNLCIFSGRLTNDTELRYTANGKAVCNFGIAVETGYGDNKTTVFLNCVLWNKEKLAPHLIKGKPVTIQGEYTERKYTDKGGNEKRVVEIVVRDLEFQQGQSANRQSAPVDAPAPAQHRDFDGDDSVPF